MGGAVPQPPGSLSSWGEVGGHLGCLGRTLATPEGRRALMLKGEFGEPSPDEAPPREAPPRQEPLRGDCSFLTCKPRVVRAPGQRLPEALPKRTVSAPRLAQARPSLYLLLGPSADVRDVLGAWGL